ncbi:hypothetical protein O6H91_06G060100 [Diphasiastrum complanatum]|uniref:Uncharacterized protein n=1 Tax=Diphasiastrum complanatum TaxID=34168 RepID=A0ACC2DE02_DIPCM|nr:hypothetical protein O6H91_06G060100 [Diphasiastrum complanatum]
MERVREGRRGGAGGNGPVSAPRRARTSGGFKDLTGGEEDDPMDEVHSSRLRERLKKETSSLYSVKRVISATGVSHSRTKRKRQELQIQARNSHMDEGDDATDDTDIGLSEDDDDPPPPAIPRWPGKPKLQTRLDVESIAVDLLAVPRKARSAMVKRTPELPTQNVEVGASNPSPAPASPRQASPSNVLSSSSNIATKRTKPSGSKSRTSKMPKTANSLSENEVEVAEALSDFARMMVNQAHPPAPESSAEIKPNRTKIEHSSGTAISLPGSVVTTSALVEIVKSEPVINASSPLQPSAPVVQSSPPVVCPPQPALPSGEVTAPKRKRPRVRPRQEDAGYTPQIRSFANARTTQAANGGSLPAPREPDHNVSGAETAVVSETKTSSVNLLPLVTETPLVTDTGHSSRDNEGSSDEHQHVAAKPIVAEDIATKLETSSPKANQKAQPLDSSKENAVLENSSVALLPAGEVETIENSPCVLDESINVSAEMREPKSLPSSDSNPPVNVEINLMKSPKALSAVTKEQIPVVSAPEISEAQENGNVDMAVPVRIPWLEKEQQRLKENNMEKSKEKAREVQEQKLTLDDGTFSGSLPKKQEAEEASNNEEKMNNQSRQFKLESAPKLPWELANTEKTADKPEMPSSLSLASESANKLTLSTPSDAATVPSTHSLAGWTQSLSPLGYYGSAAAAMAAAAVGAWPGVSALAGASMSDEKTVQLPPYLMKPPQSRKRCSTHVYIAHLIAMQQCMARQSFYTNPFGSSSNSHRASSHAFNPAFPPFEAILSHNAEMFPGSSVPGASSGNAVASAGFSVRAASDQVPEATALPSSLEPGEKERQPPSLADSVSKRQITAQQLFSAQLPSTSPQAGLPILFPPNVATTGTGNGVTGAANGTGSSANVMASGNYLNAINRDAVIQQNNLSFSFPPPHFTPLAFGGGPYLGQQAPQYFNNPYYSMHLVHPPPQQGQSLPDVVAGLTQKQSQAQGVGSFLTTGSSQQQQQPPQPQSPTKSSQGLHQGLEKDGNLESDDGSARRSFSLHRNSHGQQSNNLTSNQTAFPNSLLGTSFQVLPGHVQDYDFMTPVSGKQVAKTPQHKASVRSQIQQQSVQSPKQHQQTAVARQHGAGSALQMSLKEIEAQASQMYGNMPYRLPATTQGLEALAMSSIGRGSSTLQLNSKASDVQGSKIYDTGSLSKTSAGAGPLGLAPVAAVMAPQGHAVFQNMMDLARNYTQQPQARDNLNVQSSSHSMPQTQQQHRSLQSQRAVARAEEVRMLLDGNNFGDSSAGRESLEDRILVKRTASVPSRADVDTLSNPQGSSQSANGGGSTHSQISGISAPLGHASGALSSRPNTPTSVGAPIGASPVNHQSKHAGLRAKVAASGNAAVSMSSQSFPTYSDRPGVSSAKVQGQGSNLGQTIPNSQSARQIQAFANAQVKPSQRASLGSTAAGPQALLAAAMTKTQGQQLRNQPALTSPSAGLRIPSSISAPSSSPPILSHQSPGASKSSGLSTGKIASNGKGSGSLPQKSSGGHSGKRSNAMPAQIGTSQTVQSLPSKSSHQQHQQLSQPLQHFSSFPVSAQQQHSYAMVQQSSSNQMQQQQTAKSPLQHHQQFQMRHHPSIQQQQQQQLLHSHAQQQQSSVQQQQSDSSSQPQQQPSSLHLHEFHHLLLQQQPQNSHQTNVSHLQSLPAPTVSNSDGGSQALVMGAPAAGHGTNYARVASDGSSLNQVATARGSPRSTSKSSTSSTQGNSASHRNISTGPTSIHSQYASSNGTSLGQSQAMSPLFHSVAGLYMQATSTPGTAKSSGQKNSSGSGLEPMNALQTPVASAVKPPQNPAGALHVHDEKQQAADSYSGKVG